jgi:hypothetical protein
LVFPHWLPNIGFWFTLGFGVMVAAICFGLIALLVKNSGIDLL